MWGGESQHDATRWMRVEGCVVDVARKAWGKLSLMTPVAVGSLLIGDR